MNPNQHSSFFDGIRLGKIFILMFALCVPFFTNAQLSISFTSTSPGCNGWTNGTVTASASGGLAPYTYNWANGTFGPVLMGVGAGTYSVTATDASGQTTSSSFTLTEPAVLSVTFSLSNVCSGNGNATASAVGGVLPYQFAWDNGATGAVVTGLSTGIHCVTVTDASGCQAVGCKNVPAVLSVDLLVQGLACFNFCDASVTANFSGGEGPYTFNWSNGATGPVNPNLGPGIYTVTVTDGNACTATASAQVGNPVPISINITVTNPPCGAGGTGSATATASGGESPYTYLWNFGANSATVSGLMPGNYSVTVTDALGCTETESVAIVALGNLTLSITANPSSACGAPDGSATVAISGGTAPFNIVWSNGGSTPTITGLAPGNYNVVVTDVNGCGASAQVSIAGTPAMDLNITGVSAGCAANGSANAMVTPGTGTPPFTFLWNTGATTPIINNLVPGTYSVTATDAAGCTAVRQVTVTGSANLVISTTGTPVSCFGGSNGSATATASGGSGTLTFKWSNGANGATVNGLAVGTYFVTVTDSGSGCTAFTNVFINQPAQLVATASSTNSGCLSGTGTATANVSGGTAPYTFAWSNGGTGQTLTGLNPGPYMVTATDSKGCTALAMTSVGTSGGPSISITVTQPSGNNANNGSLTVVTTGGTAPFTINWSTGATTPTISGLGAGSYSVTVTDANSCSDVETVQLVNPACLGDRVWNDVDRDGCQDPGEFGIGGIIVTLTGTTSTGSAVNLKDTTSLNGQYLFDNLAPGTYSVHFGLLTDYVFSPANSCSDDFTDSDANASGNTGTYTLTQGQCNVTVDAGMYDKCQNVSDPGTICCNQTLCGPGNDPAPITSQTPASGGVGPIQYLWMKSNIPGPFNQSSWVPITGATGASYDPGPLSETTYYIRCTKTADCDDWLESNIVTITVGNVAVADISGPDLVCVSDTETYSAQANPTGATYSWNFGPWATPSTSNQPTVNVTWNQAGVVYVTLTVTYNGCTSTDVLGVAISNSPVICGNMLVINVDNTASSVVATWDQVQMPGNIEFGVQRSADGVTFEEIGIVPQKNGPGIQSYTFVDHSPKKGNSFYRLEQRKNNGYKRLSNKEKVERFDKSAFMLSPNPASSFVVIENSNKIKTKVKVELLSLEGRGITTEIIGEGVIRHSMDVSELRAGSYYLRLTYNDGEKEVLKFVKI